MLPFDLKDRLHIVMQANRTTGRFNLELDQWAFFSFKLTVPSPVYVELDRTALSKLSAFNIVLRRTTAADLVSGSAGLPTDVDQVRNPYLNELLLFFLWKFELFQYYSEKYNVDLDFNMITI